MTKESYIRSWEVENYSLPDDLKNRMLSNLSLGGIVAKLDEMSAWHRAGGLWKT